MNTRWAVLPTVTILACAGSRMTDLQDSGTDASADASSQDATAPESGTDAAESEAASSEAASSDANADAGTGADATDATDAADATGADADAGTPYVAITITNSQASATGSDFQQTIAFDPTQSSAWIAAEAADLGNIRFYVGNTELVSWCESGCDNATSTNAVFWLKLPNGIAANASVVVDMEFLSTATAYDGTYAGQAPQLSSTYGQYDNGSSVFADYWNFASSSDLTGWNVARATATASDGLTLTCTSAGASYAPCGMAYGAKSISQPYVAESLAKPASRIAGFGVISDATPSAGANEFLSFVFGYVSYAPSWYWNGNVGASTGSAMGANFGVIQVEAQSSSDLFEAILGTGSYAVTSWNGGAGYLAFGGTSTGDSLNAYWARTRVEPPGSVMPSVSLGALTQ